MNFDEQPQSNDPRDPFPEGWYAAMIEHAQDTESKKGKQMVSVEWKLAKPKNGEFVFKKAWSYFVMGNAGNMTMLKKLCATVGLATSGNLPAEQLIGKKLEVYVNIEIDDTGKYKPKNIVTGYRTPGGAPPPKPVEIQSPTPDDDIPF